MRWWNEMKYLFRKLNRKRADLELEEEFRTHLELETLEKIEDGLSPEEARDAARRRFGNQATLREVSREVWGFGSIERLFQDLRFGVRIFLKSPGLTAVLILTIALGIGFNSALFSVVNTLLLNPLPFPDANHLVIAWTKSAKTSSTRLGVTPEEFEEWQREHPSYMTVAGQYRTFLNLSGMDEPERIQGARVSTNFFSTLGIKPALGRDFLP